MARVLEEELLDLRERLMTCFRETLPTEEIRTSLSLTIIWLGVLADRETRTQDPKERRRLKHDFDERKQAIEHGIERLYEQTEGRGFKVSLASPLWDLQGLRSACPP